MTVREPDAATADPADGEPSVPDASTATPSIGPPTALPRTFAEGPPRLSRRSRIWLVVGLVVAVAVATAVNRLATPGPAHPVSALRQPDVGGVAAPADAAQLHAPLAAFMGVTSLHRAPAPAWTLTDPVTDTPVPLTSFRGQVVVLTFVDAACDDICPVMAQELADAATDLTTRRLPLAFVTVNSDPLSTSGGPGAAIFDSGDFDGVPGWTFVTGSLHKLNRVWTAYGISITANPRSHRVSHNDLLYVIGPDQTLRESAIPFADESKSQTFSLTGPAIERFGAGIAHYVEQAAA
jgi:cytochrome oxidase Cu insertion factor (SCO1/SenC/PrrC family)